jgi:proteasome assembly chaperone (PAC2) family protein
MADELRITTLPELRSPVLVAAFRGWNDGAHGATLAAEYLSRVWKAQRFADVDPEEFFDFQATRPHVSLVDGITRRIDWPDNAFLHASPPGLERDIVLMIGVEPNLHWRRFSTLVVELAKRLDIQLVVTLGALLADVPHTRPVPVTGSASDPELVQRLGLAASRYEGPTGIVGVLHDAFREAAIPSASLWAAVPHYVSLTPSPRAAEALCNRLGELLEYQLDVAELAEAGREYVEHVTDAVVSDSETQAYVEALEQQADELEAEEQSLPSGDSIAAELTRFLRDHDARQGGPDDAAREQ